MVDSSAGKILSQARLAKRLTIDEVAHATKLRPDKIVALENDDFARFGSLAYGKGFLQIYARFLGVDITPQLRGMEVSSTAVSISDYQYLNSPHPAPPAPRRSVDRQTERRDRRDRIPSIIPLLIVLTLGTAGIYGFYVLNAPRIGLDAAPTQPANAASSLLHAPVPTSEAPSTPALTPEVAPASVAPKPELSDRPSAPPRPAAPRPGSTPAVATADAAFLASDSHAPVARAVPALDENPGVINELIVEPIKKTWVKIHKDSPDSPPIFEDYLYPGVRPLKLRGARFFVEVRDQSAVQIRKNGHPIAYQAPGISIQ